MNRRERHGAPPSPVWLHIFLRKVFRSGCRLPDFVIPGAQKCGTNFLFLALSRHPQVIPSATKEVHFFDMFFDRGEGWYRANFPHWEEIKLKRVRERMWERKVITGRRAPTISCTPMFLREWRGLSRGQK
jgi:hypothetical protein